jgi:uncharacterized protein
MEYEIHHDKDKHKFYCVVEGKECVAQYVIIGEYTLDFVHTYVPPEFRGRGIAGKIYDETLKYLIENHLKAKASCSYAEKYFKDHKEIVQSE